MNYQNPFQVNPMNQMGNPYMLPPQQVIQVNGKSSVDSIQLAPNSSVLLMDTSAPIVWLCVSDGVGKVMSTPYDITVHKDTPQPDVESLEQRLAKLEKMISEMEDKKNESNVEEPSSTKPKHSTIAF